MSTQSIAPSRSQFFTLLLVVFIDLLGFGIIIPILPYYSREFGASALQLGWLMSVYSLMNFFFAPVWGRISDRIGRRPVLCISILGTAISLTMLGFANSLTWLFVGRLFAGICGANISTAYAYMADITTPENRAKGMGLIGAAFGMGFIFGPAIGGLLAPYGYSAPLFFGAGLAVMNFILAIKLLKEPTLTPEQRSAHRSKRFSLESWQVALSDARCRFAIISFLVVTVAVTQMEVSFALFLKEAYQMDARAAGLLLALLGVVMVAVQGGLIHRWVKRYGEIRLVVAAQLLTAVALFVFGATTQFSILVLALVALAVGNGMLQPSLSSLVSLGAPAHARGMVMGVFQSAGSLARVIGPPCAGWLYDSVSMRAPFYSGSILLCIAGLTSALWARRFRSTASVS